MRRELRAMPTLLRVGFADAVAYRAEFLVWILSTNMPLIMLALWTAVAREYPVGGFGQREFVAYYLSALVVRMSTGAWAAWEINYELRQGLLAFRLLRPIHPLVQYAAENAAALPVRALFALPIAAASLWAMGRESVTHDPLVVALFVLSVLGAWAINFLSQALIGSLGFFVHSSLSVWEVWLGLYMLLSGYLIPLALFPPWLLEVSRVLPFRYMLSFPVELILGAHPRAAALAGLGVQWAIVAALAAAAALLWRAGMRRFVAYGG